LRAVVAKNLGRNPHGRPLGLALAESTSPFWHRHDGGLERAGKAGRAGVHRINNKGGVLVAQW